MAKDANGAALRVGDEVMIPCKVLDVLDGKDDGHNVTLQSLGLHSAEAEQTTNFALNGRQCVIIPHAAARSATSAS